MYLKLLSLNGTYTWIKLFSNNWKQLLWNANWSLAALCSAVLKSIERYFVSFCIPVSIIVSKKVNNDRFFCLEFSHISSFSSFKSKFPSGRSNYAEAVSFHNFPHQKIRSNYGNLRSEYKINYCTNETNLM